MDDGIGFWKLLAALLPSLTALALLALSLRRPSTKAGWPWTLIRDLATADRGKPIDATTAGALASCKSMSDADAPLRDGTSKTFLNVEINALPLGSDSFVGASRNART